jgi:hypothetical protein
VPWTYTNSPFAGNPYSSPPVIPTPQQNRDSVRFLVGDTDSNDQQLDDQEVDGLLNANQPVGSPFPNVYLAAAQACISLAARYMRRASMTVGDLSIQLAQVADNYRNQRKYILALANRHLQGGTQPYVGGISESDMDADETDEDLVEYWVTLNFTDNEGASTLGQAWTRVVPE